MPVSDIHVYSNIILLMSLEACLITTPICLNLSFPNFYTILGSMKTSNHSVTMICITVMEL